MSETFDPGDAKDTTAAMFEARMQAWEARKAETADWLKHEADVDSAVISAGRTGRQLIWLTVAILVFTMASLAVGIATLVRT